MVTDYISAAGKNLVGIRATVMFPAVPGAFYTVICWSILEQKL
jgi:hypothetical protein